MRDHEMWAESLALAYVEPDAKTGKRLAHAEVLARIEAALHGAQNTSVLADDTEIPAGGTLPATPEAELCAALANAFAASRAIGAALRQDVLEAVEEGAMQPLEAEAWAKRFGWPAFTGWANAEHFDPRSISTWSLSQTAAWIAHRETDPSGIYEMVCRFDPARIAASTRWIKTETGHEIAAREDRGYSAPEGESTDAKDQLLAALRAGQIVAEGERDGVVHTIPAEEWPRLVIVGFHDKHGVHRVVRAEQSGREVYAAVRVRRASVLKVWPETKPFAEPDLKPIKEAKAQSLLKAWAAAKGGLPDALQAEEWINENGYKGRDVVRGVLNKMKGNPGRGRPKRK